MTYETDNGTHLGEGHGGGIKPVDPDLPKGVAPFIDGQGKVV